MRTGSSVRSTASFLVATAGRETPSSSGSTSSSGSWVSSSSELVGALDDVDAHFADRRHDVLDLLGAHLVLRQRLVEFVIGDDALLLRACDQLLDRDVVEVDQRRVAGFGFGFGCFCFRHLGFAAYSLLARDASLSL
jgi:hypothetical protein